MLGHDTEYYCTSHRSSTRDSNTLQNNTALSILQLYVYCSVGPIMQSSRIMEAQQSTGIVS